MKGTKKESAVVLVELLVHVAMHYELKASLTGHKLLKMLLFKRFHHSSLSASAPI